MSRYSPPGLWQARGRRQFRSVPLFTRSLAQMSKQSVAVVAPIRRIPISVRPVCPVSVSIVPIVPAPIRAPMYPAINARNASWSERTTNHRRGGVDRQRHTALRREAKRHGSCAQNAGEECGRSDGCHFRHCDLQSTPPSSPWRSN